jgi:hypothetical protein
MDFNSSTTHGCTAGAVMFHLPKLVKGIELKTIQTTIATPLISSWVWFQPDSNGADDGRALARPDDTRNIASTTNFQARQQASVLPGKSRSPLFYGTYFRCKSSAGLLDIVMNGNPLADFERLYFNILRQVYRCSRRQRNLVRFRVDIGDGARLITSKRHPRSKRRGCQNTDRQISLQHNSLL